MVWDTAWNTNEWFVVGLTVFGFAAVALLPRRFARSTTIVFVAFGSYFGTLFDYLLAVPPLDFYDVNDRSEFEFTDSLTYLMYGPLGYLFVYLYDRLGAPGRWAPLYVFGWTVVALLLEALYVNVGVFHYKNGYRLDYSGVVYLTLQLLALALYYKFRRPAENGGNEEST